MKKVLLLFILFNFPILIFAQDSVLHRVIYIGDAGELGTQQNGVLGDAVKHIIPNKTTVFYLGDNVYPTGMGLPGSPEEENTKKILQAQYQPFRQHNVPVYFIPGNHDWDRMGPKGLAKVKREWEYINEQKDSLLNVVPPDGCPGPVEIPLTNDLTVIAFDSEWWVYIYSKNNPNADCDCKTTDEIIGHFRELLYKNRRKVILLCDHHPFSSYGHHGGTYGLVDYFFPLTSVKQSLYIPFPIVGALYPFIRANFANPEDNTHPLYKNMIEQIDGVFGNFPNVTHVSGHEHGLQFINDKRTQIVSGSGAKRAFVEKGKKALFAQKTPGYVTADLLSGKKMRYTFYTTADSVYKPVFSYDKPYVPVEIDKPYAGKPVLKDSIVVQARPDLDSVSKLHRTFYGENYRKEWAAAVKLPVIRISEIKGGLQPERLGGIHQTHSLLLKDKKGKEWILSNIERYPEVILTEEQSEKLPKTWLWDAISAQHPYASLMAPVLADAVKMPHTNPQIGWVSPDKRFGYYEKTFANTICLLEENNPGGPSDNTGKMLRKLDHDNDNLIDTAEFLKARLLDWFMGDWDQQEDQWRWVNKSRGDNKYYFAVPRDRDEAFYVNQGFMPRLNSKLWLAPYLKGYTAGPHEISYFYYSGRNLNDRFLAGLDHDKWMQITKQFAAALTDSVLNAALLRLPKEIWPLRNKLLFQQMKYRRDNLKEAAETYYKFFNHVVDVKASDKNELININDTLNGRVIVTINKISRKGNVKQVLFSKIFDPTITREVRVFASKGDDSVFVNIHKSPIKLRIIGGTGKKVYDVESAGAKIDIHEKVDNAVFMGAAQNRVSKYIKNDSSNVAFVPTNLYSVHVPVLQFGYNRDEGPWLSAGARFIYQGFRKNPGNVQQVRYLGSFDNNSNKIYYEGIWMNAVGKADLELRARADVPQVINFFGEGNATPNHEYDDHKTFYRARFDLLDLNSNLRWHNYNSSVSLRIGPELQYYHYQPDNNVRLINDPNAIKGYDVFTVGKDKVHLGLMVNYIDDKRNDKVLPSWGVYVDLKLVGFAGLNMYSRGFLQAIPSIELYKSVNTRSSIVIADKLGGGLTFGKTTFYQSLFLGGADNMPGYRLNRFAGQQMFYNMLEGRIKLNNMATYILPGQYGITGSFAIGKVWQQGETSALWHNSVAGGFYFSPADLALIKLQAGHSNEGWYPFLSVNIHF